MKAIILIALILAVSFAQSTKDYQKCAQDAMTFAQTA